LFLNFRSGKRLQSEGFDLHSVVSMEILEGELGLVGSRNDEVSSYNFKLF